MLSQLKNLIFSKYSFGLVLFLIFAAMVWFLGPHFGIDTLYPLGQMEPRIAMILWGLLVAVVYLWAGPMHLVWFVGILLVFWYILPNFSFFNIPFLQSSSSRWIAVGVLVALYALYLIVILFLKLRRDPDFADKLLRSKEPVANHSKKLRAQLQELFTPVRQGLKQSKGYLTGFGRLLAPKGTYLYHLPWILVLGSKASGKSTLIANARFPFVLPEQTAQAAIYNSSATPPATEFCQFWLTNAALYVDVEGAICQPEASPQTNERWNVMLSKVLEWRSRNGINSAIITISVEELLFSTPVALAQLTAQLTARLEEVRHTLGISFPVYCVITKMDRVLGFESYFRTMTTEARDQVFGFTLPYITQSSSLEPFLKTEFDALLARCERGVTVKLQDEMEIKERQALTVFPNELEHLNQKVYRVVQAVFFSPLKENAQAQSSLRGVYYCSAAQAEGAKLSAVSGRLQDAWIGYGLPDAGSAETTVTSHRSYFIHDLLKKVIHPESGLVQPNRRIERLTFWGRMVLGSLLLLVGAWGSFGLLNSHHNNHLYLAKVAQKANVLRDTVATYIEKPTADKIPVMLNLADALPKVSQWNMEQPPLSVRYGLYAAPALLDASQNTYHQMLDHLLLSYIRQNMEQSLQQAIQERDFQATANALCVYLMLHDGTHQHYQAEDFRAWVLRDWVLNNRGVIFSNEPAMLNHVKHLLESRPALSVQTSPQKGLIEAARKLLRQNVLPNRIYQRILFRIAANNPARFTLLSALGPHASLTFQMASGISLEKGVPGLYTYEGYYSNFYPFLLKHITRYVQYDAWLMGLPDQDAEVRMRQVTEIQQEVQTLYLQEYAAHWQAFLEDLDVVTGTSIAYDLNILRDFVGSQSPLNRLAPHLLKQLTLSKSPVGLAIKPLNVAKSVAKSPLGKIPLPLDSTQLGANALEQTVVDEVFAPLRHMLASTTVEKKGETESAAQSISGLQHFNGMLGEYYTYLSMTNAQLITTTAIPDDHEITDRLLLEASKLPDPLARILRSFVMAGSEKINASKAESLRRVAQAQFKEMMDTLQSTVTNMCDLSIDGRYPFANSSYEVNVADFNKLFSSAGSIERFYTTYLSPFVDTQVRPWRYKTPQKMALQEALASEHPEFPAEMEDKYPITVNTELLDLLAEHGPDPELFAIAKDIQTTFFQAPGASAFALFFSYRIEEVDASIVELILNIDGQSQRYVHEPMREISVTWPGKNQGSLAELIAKPLVRADTSRLRLESAWALFRLLDAGKRIGGSEPDAHRVGFELDGRKVVMRFRSPGAFSPFNLQKLRQFQCPRMQ